jgi:hypothetical protein
MAVQPPNKTLPQDKDIVVSEAKVTGSSDPREQLSQVLTNFDEAIQKEISDRIADVEEEEERARIAEAYLAKLIEEEREARIAGDGNTDGQNALDQESQARQDADAKISNSIFSSIEPLRIIQSSSSTKAVHVSKAWELRTNPVTGSPDAKIVIPNGTAVSSFNGADINFSTGVNDAGSNFAPINFLGHEGEYARYLVILLPDDSLEVRPSNEFHTDPQQTPYPSLATNGILVGSIVVKDNGSGGVGTISDIDPLLISVFKDSMGSATASAPVINTSPLELQEGELFTYYTKEDFQEDKGVNLESTTGLNSIASNSEVVLNAGQSLTSKNLAGSQLLKDAFYLNAAQAKILYKNSNIDPSPVVQFSRNNGETWLTGTTYRPASEGNLIVSDIVFPSVGSTPLFQAGSPSGTKSGTHIGAIILTPYDTFLNAVSYNVRTTSTTGTVKAKIYLVTSGTPQSVITESAQSYSCGSDITSAFQEKKFILPQVALKSGQQYALVIEGESLNGTLEVEQSTDPAAYNISSASKNGGGWVPSADKLAFKLFGSGYELKMKITSSAAGSKVAGFGVNYVTDTSFMTKGTASWEDRTVTSDEASSGSIVLSQIVYSAGIRQLRLNIDGKEYFAPNDFTEVGTNEVLFPSGFLQVGQKLRFYNTYGLVDTGIIASMGASQQDLAAVQAQVDSNTNKANDAIARLNVEEPKVSSLQSSVATLQSNYVKNNHAATVDPVSGNNASQGYSFGSLWFNRTNNTLWAYNSETSGVARWEALNTPRNKIISSTVVDWSNAETHYKDVSSNTTFTFSNIQEGKSIVVVIKNTSGSTITSFWPAGVLKDSSYTGQIAAGKETIFTFIRSNSKTYLAEYKDLA